MRKWVLEVDYRLNVHSVIHQMCGLGHKAPNLSSIRARMTTPTSEEKSQTGWPM